MLPQNSWHLHNGIVRSGPDWSSPSEQLNVRDGLITNARTLPEQAVCFDLHGHALYPGFVDAHVHLEWYGMQAAQVDLCSARSWEEVLQRLEKAGAAEKGNLAEWLEGYGLNEQDWPGPPRPEQLEVRFPGKPILLERVDRHAGIASTAALHGAGLDKKALSQSWLDDHQLLALRQSKPAPDNSQRKAAFRKALTDVLAHGITALTDAWLTPEAGSLLAEVLAEPFPWPQVSALLEPEAPGADPLLERGPHYEGKLLWNGIKLFADGAFGSRGAWLSVPYADAPACYGDRMREEVHYRHWAARALHHHWPLATHAIGDAAHHFVLNLYDSLLPPGNTRRWRIEHAQLIHPEDDLSIYAKKSIIPSIQPAQRLSDQAWLHHRLGHERSRKAHPANSLRQNAGLLAYGTDFPIEPIDPVRGFLALVRADEDNVNTQEQLSREEALNSMTHWAAYSQSKAHGYGTLDPGKQANLVLWRYDWMTAPASLLAENKPLVVWMGGTVAYINWEEYQGG